MQYKIQGITIVTAVIILFVSCSGRQVTSTGYVCTKHGTHHLEDRFELAGCLGVDYKALVNDSFYIFRDTGYVSGTEDPDMEAERTRDRVKDKIVDLMVRKMEAAVGRMLYTRWRFDSMAPPVKFREFRKKEGDTTRILILGVIERKEFEPRNIIKYLPLEYKMQIMENEEE